MGIRSMIRSMNRLLLKLALVATVGSLLSANPAAAQILPPQKRAERVEITQGPALELAHDDLAIVRWTTTNPRGDDEHFGIVRYGTDPEDLSRTAKGHIRLNRAHPETIFRVRMEGLEPRTTYYYKVTSMASNGESDGVESPVSQFTTPAPGKRIVAYPPQPALSPK
jgi:phosphodiesterase/alkaline phosphatase D-like protein